MSEATPVTAPAPAPAPQPKRKLSNLAVVWGFTRRYPLAIGIALVALTVWLAAPSATDFNEYRWVMLAPWGRLGLMLGGIAVIAITLLAWRASRGARGWRRIRGWSAARSG